MSHQREAFLAQLWLNDAIVVRRSLICELAKPSMTPCSCVFFKPDFRRAEPILFWIHDGQPYMCTRDNGARASIHCTVASCLIIYPPNNQTVEGSFNNSFPYKSLDSQYAYIGRRSVGCILQQPVASFGLNSIIQSFQKPLIQIAGPQTYVE